MRIKNKDMEALEAILVSKTKEANKKYFENLYQHGGDDVTYKRRIVC
jgi:hypothetical protein